MIRVNGKMEEEAVPTSGYELLKKLKIQENHLGVAIDINGQLRHFSDPILAGDDVKILSFEDKKGREVFWHSSAHLLAAAILRLYPNALPTIGPPIEAGFYYDFGNLTLKEEDFSRIEEEMQRILKEGDLEFTKTLFPGKEEALKAFVHNPYKCELIRDLPEGEPITAYQVAGFFDLCRGPHLPSLKKIKSIKILKTSAAHFRGDQRREMLTRVYAISFPDPKEMKNYLTQLEEIKKRDHRVLGKELDLFSFLQVAPGMPLFHPKGLWIFDQLIAFWKELHKARNYELIKTPMILDRELWERSGHWANYRENMYSLEIENKDSALKPMNCPACMLYFSEKKHSYKEFPLRVGEIGHVHRHELSGSLSGLLRVRCFHQDDAHIFMYPSQITQEILEILQLADIIYTTFGLSYTLELSTRPTKSIGSDEDWKTATEGLQQALEQWGRPYKINEGDGAFYGPKIDLHIRDALGRFWQCGTVQLDMSLPVRFDLEYTDSEGKACRPIMVHRALYGSLERFMAVIIEHFAGKFPLWINPNALCLIPVADRHVEYAKTIKEAIDRLGLPCYIDESHESVSKKVRVAQLKKTNYMITIGDEEVENNTISVRSRDGKLLSGLSAGEFYEQLKEEAATRSLLPCKIFQDSASFSRQ